MKIKEGFEQELEKGIADNVNSVLDTIYEAIREQSHEDRIYVVLKAVAMDDFFDNLTATDWLIGEDEEEVKRLEETKKETKNNSREECDLALEFLYDSDCQSELWDRVKESLIRDRYNFEIADGDFYPRDGQFQSLQQEELVIIIEKIKIKINKYNQLTEEEAKQYFKNDSESLELLEQGHVAYLFVNEDMIDDIVQYAIVPEDFNPSNIDRWGEDDWSNIEDFVVIED